MVAVEHGVGREGLVRRDDTKGGDLAVLAQDGTFSDSGADFDETAIGNGLAFDVATDFNDTFVADGETAVRRGSEDDAFCDDAMRSDGDWP